MIEAIENIRGVWFMFSYLLEIENSDENAFSWIFKNIFSKNIFSNE